MDGELRGPSRWAAIGLLAIVSVFVAGQVGVLVRHVWAVSTAQSSGGLIAPDIESDRVAATPAEFRVDESGSAGYRIPIFTVPGTAGVAPTLALSYSSQSGYGPLGKGWAIDGLSSISRCRKTREAGDFIEAGAPVDGDPRPVGFSDSDRYCLDGQRLVSSTEAGGICPAVAGMSAETLRTEIDSFQRVCAYTPAGGATGVAFFTVERKDGSTSWYGDRDASSTANRPDGYVNSTAPGRQAFALFWAQTRFQDSTGNYIDFIYHENPAGAQYGEHLLGEVRYTGKNVLPGQAGNASQPFARVVFNYSVRPTGQWSTGYVAGGLLAQTRRLDSVISCSAAGSGACPEGEQVRYYNLGHAASPAGTGSDVLMSVEECRSSSRSVCLPPTTFTWSAGRYEFATAEYPSNLPTGSLEKFEGFKTGDIDGDGRQDIVYLKDGSSGEACSTENIFVLYADAGAGATPTYVQSAPMCTPTELMSSRGEGSWHLFDYNGDGRDDLFVSGPAGTGWRVHLSQGRAGNSNFLPQNALASQAPLIPSVDGAEDQVQLADLNGDGLTDVLYPAQGVLKARVMERAGNAFTFGAERTVVVDPATLGPEDGRCTIGATCDRFLAGSPITKTGFSQLADFNGDGSSDVMMMDITRGRMYIGGPGCEIEPLRMAARPGPLRYVERRELEGDSSSTKAAASSAPPIEPNPCYERFERHLLHALQVTGVTATTITLTSYAATEGQFEAVTLADANGDGLSDLFFRALGNNRPWQYRINTGAGMLPEALLPASSWNHLVRFVDANGDGRADMLRPVDVGYQKVYRAILALPSGGYAPSETNIAGGNARLCEGSGCNQDLKVPMFFDMDGDGSLDFMSLKLSDNADLYLSRASVRHAPREVITTFENGLGARTEIGYAALTNAGVYRRDSGTRSLNWGRGAAVSDLFGPLYVVASAGSTSPTASSPGHIARLYYRYAGAKVQAGGRGLLGFREIVTYDPNQTGGYVSTQTLYNQGFPLTGMPYRTVKRAAAGAAFTPSGCLGAAGTNGCFSGPGQAFSDPVGAQFSHATQVWETDQEAGSTASQPFSPGVQAPIHVRTAGTDEYSYDLVSQALNSRIATAFGYGAYGNVVLTIADTYTGSNLAYTATTSNTYAQDNVARWRLGRLTQSVVTHQRPGVADVVRTASFKYAMGGAATGLLVEERRQPGGGAEHELIKVYQLDDYGNRVRTSLCSADVANCGSGGVAMQPSGARTINRYSRVAYVSAGRFAGASYEPFGSGELSTLTVQARDAFGTPTHASDLNGVDTHAVSGSLGRPYYQWIETEPGTAPGGSSGVTAVTTYRWCGSAGVECPAGAKFRERAVRTAAPAQWTYFDALGRAVLKVAESFNAGVSNKDLAATCTRYDVVGRPVQVSSPFFVPGLKGIDGPTGLSGVCTAPARIWTTTTYDVLGRVTSVVAPDGAVTTQYEGLTTRVTDPRGNATVTQANGKGEVVRITDAAGLATFYSYSGPDQVTSIVRDAGRGNITHSFGYDASGRKSTQFDPDSGATSFEYNALGEVLAEQDAEGHRTEQRFDARGRVYRRVARRYVASTGGYVDESTSTYQFDTVANGAGKLGYESIQGAYEGLEAPASMRLGFARSYTYDSLGRSVGATTSIDGVDYPSAVQYDPLGRAWKTQDASGEWTKTSFSARGMAQATCHSNASDIATACPSSASTFARTLETDAWGNVVRERRAENSGMEVRRTYNAATGKAVAICAGTANCELVNEQYQWDGAGNLVSHLKENRYLEGFDYDALNRLTRGTLLIRNGVTANTVSQSFDYDAVGNVCRKTSLGVTQNYVYTGRAGCGATTLYGGGGTGPIGPHQAYQVGDAFHYYDARGNQTLKDAPGTAQDRVIRYSADGHAFEVRLGGMAGATLSRFWYGSDGQRYRVSHIDTGETVHYVGGVEVQRQGGIVTFKRYLPGDYLQTRVGSAVTERYLFKDQLGSLVRMTDAGGAVVNSADYSAFGERRSYTDPQAKGAGTPPTKRGFTGHEHFERMGIIHMNARLFDPGLGRFLQPDPVVQAPHSSQGWNAYTYVFNNPLRYTDPSGMVGLEERRWLGAAFAIIATVFAPNGAGFWYSVFVGATAGGISTGSWKGAARGAFSAGLTYGVGLAVVGSDRGVQILANAATGGVVEYLSGGNFGSGFAAAGLTAAAMPRVRDIEHDVRRSVTAALVSGTASIITGGKFANGAVSGAIQSAVYGASEDAVQARGASGGENSDSAPVAEVAAFIWDTGIFGGVKPFNSAGDALFAAGRAISDSLLSSQWEYAGFVIPVDGGFIATQPVTSYSNVNFRLGIARSILPAGANRNSASWRVYHNHPNAGPAPSFFSPEDVAHSLSSGMTSYIFTPGNGLRAFFPSSTRVSTIRVEGGVVSKASKGVLVCQPCGY